VHTNFLTIIIPFFVTIILKKRNGKRLQKREMFREIIKIIINP